MNPSDATVVQRGPMRRKASEMTDYKEHKQPAVKWSTQPKSREWVMIEGRLFKCYADEKVTRMPRQWRELLRPRKQDDDRDSDEEVILSAVSHNFRHLVEGINEQAGMERKVCAQDFFN